MDQLYYLRTDRIKAAIQETHLSQAGFADDVQLSRCHWSQVLNRRRHATARVRRALLTHPALRGIPESELWDVVRTSGRTLR